METTSRGAKAYIVTVVTTGCIALAVSVFHVAPDDWPTIAVLALVHLVLCAWSEHEQHRSTETHSSLNGIVTLAAVLLCGPAGAVVVASVDLLGEDPSRPLVKRAFNAAVLVLSAAGAGFVVAALGGGWRGLDFADFPADLLRAVCADAAELVGSGLLVTFVVALTADLRPLAVARAVFTPMSVHNLGHGLLGVALAVVWGPCQVGPLSAVLVLVPVSLARFTYRQLAEEQAAYDRTLDAVVHAIDTNDAYARGDGERVARASLPIARECNLPERRLPSLRHAAMLHDIGKIGVPAHILRKVGAFTDEERCTVQRHPALGRDMIADVAFLREAEAAILCHHERMDGLGYPMGLAGEDIPELARVIAVAAAFDAMTSDRVHRPAGSVEAAVAELRRCAGTQFDQHKVRALVRALDRAPWQPTSEHATKLIADVHSSQRR